MSLSMVFKFIKWGVAWFFEPLLMTWYFLPKIYTGQLVTDSHFDKMRENVEHIGNMKFAGVAWKDQTAISGCRHTVGSYVGNGSDNHAITGLGFTPKTLIIIGGSDIASSGWAMRFGTSGVLAARGTTTWTPMGSNDSIKSYDSDGFTLGTSYGNANGYTYYYAAWG